MVARINSSKSLARSLNYNEKKLQRGKAEILLASGFLKSPGRLNFYDKMRRFNRLTELNRRTVTNCMHVSLNFDPAEKISNDKMEAIAVAYMNKIGFGKQPFLVYRHHDSGHPHLHIVTTNIKSDGERISMHRLGAVQSEKARKEIEMEFNLVKAQDQKKVSGKIIPVNISKVIYGKSEIKQAVSNVLTEVINGYKFGLLPEFNAVLGLYNVAAERGATDSRMYKNNGLVYRVLDEKGNKVGAGIKASLFYMNPTFKMLQQKFIENEQLKVPCKSSMQTSVNWVLNKSPKDLESFKQMLQQEGISLIIRRGQENAIYGLTYIGHKNKVVFNGSDLGKEYSAKGILDRFNSGKQVKFVKKASTAARAKAKPKQYDVETIGWKLTIAGSFTPVPYEPIPFPFRIKKKKKKKRRINL